MPDSLEARSRLSPLLEVRAMARCACRRDEPSGWRCNAGAAA